jgi:hypothetical protein
MSLQTQAGPKRKPTYLISPGNTNRLFLKAHYKRSAKNIIQFKLALTQQAREISVSAKL